MGTKHYDKAFKQNAVKLSYSRSNLSTLSKELGVSISQLSKWRRDYEDYGESSFPGRGVERLTDESRTRNIKKSNCCFLQNRHLRYNFLDNHRKLYSVELIINITNGK